MTSLFEHPSLPAETERDESVRIASAASERKGEVSSCGDGEERRRRGRGGGLFAVGENSLS